ncbi:hypothetical protein B0H13DRAFT_2317192 [Mycena leptocephala]|nr:hypothetical protein B0H13DRAFT_2317192 [Mycena leptocephala]
MFSLRWERPSLSDIATDKYLPANAVTGRPPTAGWESGSGVCFANGPFVCSGLRGHGHAFVASATPPSVSVPPCVRECGHATGCLPGSLFAAHLRHSSRVHRHSKRGAESDVNDALHTMASTEHWHVRLSRVMHPPVDSEIWQGSRVTPAIVEPP